MTGSLSKTCDLCGKEFNTKYPRQRFCSIECRKEWRNTPEQKAIRSAISKYKYRKYKLYTRKPTEVIKCGWCEREFMQNRCNQKYCTPACRDQAAYHRKAKKCWK